MRKCWDNLKQLAAQYPWVLLLALFIGAYTCLDMAHTNRERSELENRPLAARPRLTLTALLDGGYDEAFDKYINDQFVGRDGWITVKSLAEALLLKRENNGIVFGRDGYLFSKFDAVDNGYYGPNQNYVQEFFLKYPEQPITFLLAPTSYTVLADKLPAGLKLVDQRAATAEILGRVPGNVLALDPTDALLAHREEYIYYRTDHHWTTYGAYLAAQEYAAAKGLTLPRPDEARKREAEGFYGTYFSKSKRVGTPADTLTYYDIPVGAVEIDGQHKPGLYDLDKLATRDKYAMFIWGNNNFTTIRSAGNRNPVPGRTTRVLLIKDSYGNAFAPFLTYLYDEVDVIDPRYVLNLSDYMRAKEYDDVIVLYNFESLAGEPSVRNLRY